MRAVVLRDYDAAGAAVGMDGGEAKLEHGATVLPPRSDYQRVFGIEQYGYGGGKHVAGPVCAVGLGFHTDTHSSEGYHEGLRHTSTRPARRFTSAAAEL